MKKYKINWISYLSKKFNYKDMAAGSDYHTEIIFQALWFKVTQNEDIKKLLLETGDLKLRPDHLQPDMAPQSYRYHDTLMFIRVRLSH